jgi:hypothetical protein
VSALAPAMRHHEDGRRVGGPPAVSGSRLR